MSETAMITRVADWRGHSIFSIIVRVFLGVIFIWAAWHKILIPEDFALNIATYQILPLLLVNLQAIGLPWVELLVGLTLIVGLWTRESALITVGMNLMFIVAIGITLYRGEEILCGCFASGDVGHQIDINLLFRDVGLLLLGVYLVLIGHGWAAIDRFFNRKREEKK